MFLNAINYCPFVRWGSEPTHRHAELNKEKPKDKIISLPGVPLYSVSWIINEKGGFLPKISSCSLLDTWKWLFPSHWLLSSKHRIHSAALRSFDLLMAQTVIMKSRGRLGWDKNRPASHFILDLSNYSAYKQNIVFVLLISWFDALQITWNDMVEISDMKKEIFLIWEPTSMIHPNLESISEYLMDPMFAERTQVELFKSRTNLLYGSSFILTWWGSKPAGS